MIISYHGTRKLSIDTPVQAALYEMYSDINAMIHGHAYIEGAPTTEHYFPCGDLRELPEIIRLNPQAGKIINLKNHGFIMFGNGIADLTRMAEQSNFHSLLSQQRKVN